MEKELKEALADENILVLKSDNICIGSKVLLPNGAVGIIFEETEKFERKGNIHESIKNSN